MNKNPVNRTLTLTDAQVHEAIEEWLTKHLFKESAAVVGLARGPTRRRAKTGEWNVTFVWRSEELENLCK